MSVLSFSSGCDCGAPSSSAGANGYAGHCEDEPHETISERLWGLTEMFPQPLRNCARKIADLTANGLKGAYMFTCNASWVFFTSTMVLFAPVIFETERAQVEGRKKL